MMGTTCEEAARSGRGPAPSAELVQIRLQSSQQLVERGALMEQDCEGADLVDRHYEHVQTDGGDQRVLSVETLMTQCFHCLPRELGDLPATVRIGDAGDNDPATPSGQLHRRGRKL